MLESLKRILKVYPLPIFVLLLAFVVYYFAFELLKQQEYTQNPISQEESMQDSTQILANAREDSNTLEIIQEKQEAEQEILTEELKEITPELPKPQAIFLTTQVKSLNIRAIPSTQGRIVGKFTANSRWLKIDEKDGWVLVGDLVLTNPIGWVLKQYIQELQTEDNAQVSQTSQGVNAPKQGVEEIYTSRVPSLNIREAPSTEAQIVGKLTPNDFVEIIATQGPWAQIRGARNANTSKSGWVVRRSLILR